MNYQIGFLGCGQMGQALLESWLQSSQISAKKIIAVVSSSASAQALHERWGIATSTDPQVLSTVPWVVLAVKPSQWEALPLELSAENSLISIMAGVSYASLKNRFSTVRVMRWMPNLNQRIGYGITAVFDPESIFDQTPEALRSGALFCPLDQESQLAPFTALFGSGPAYIFQWLQCWEDQGRAWGFSAEKIKSLTQHLLCGSAKLWAHSAQNGNELADQVTSAGGVTAEARAVLEQAKVWETWRQALIAAEKKARGH